MTDGKGNNDLPPDPPAENPTGEAAENAPAPPTLDYFTPQAIGLVTLRFMPLMEAELARAKLESEGIISFIADRNAALINPMIITGVRLQVHPADVPLAEKILASIPKADREDVDETWRCPKCHHKPIEMAPAEPWRRVTFVLFFIFLLASVSSVILREMTTRHERLASAFDAMIGASAIATAVLAAILVLVKRRKRCPSCGWEW